MSSRRCRSCGAAISVVVRARVGGIEAEGRAIASQNGVAGDVIRLVNPDSRRTLQGRIVGAGEVEVIHES